MPSVTPTWPLTLYYDGECPLCLREILMFERRNQAQRLILIDLTDVENPVPEKLVRNDMLNLLHARFDDGRFVTGIDATYWSYSAVGLGWLVKPLTWAWARPFWLWSYRQFCKARPMLARRIPMPAQAACNSGRCAIRNSAANPADHDKR